MGYNESSKKEMEKHMERYFEINTMGHNIRCKLYCRDIHSVEKTVIFCHGFGGHKDNASAAKFAERMLNKHKRTALITFNLPCHGDDVKKKLVLEDCLTYLDLVVKYVQETYTQEVYAYATSFGGYLVLRYIHGRGNPFRRILLRSPAINLHEAFLNNILTKPEREQLEKGKEVQAGFDRKVPVTAAFLADIQENDIRKLDYLDYAEDILILHGTRDEIIPYEASLSFSEDNLVELIPIPDGDHRCRDPRKMDQVIKHILEFFAL